jgi:hypothetical protein
MVIARVLQRLVYTVASLEHSKISLFLYYCTTIYMSKLVVLCFDLHVGSADIIIF